MLGLFYKDVNYDLFIRKVKLGVVVVKTLESGGCESEYG